MEQGRQDEEKGKVIGQQHARCIKRFGFCGAAAAIDESIGFECGALCNPYRGAIGDCVAGQACLRDGLPQRDKN